MREREKRSGRERKRERVNERVGRSEKREREYPLK